jgi:hypothetical protein
MGDGGGGSYGWRGAVVLGLEMQWRVCMIVGREVVGAWGGYCDGVVMMWRIGSCRVVSCRLSSCVWEIDIKNKTKTKIIKLASHAMLSDWALEAVGFLYLTSQACHDFSYAE